MACGTAQFFVLGLWADLWWQGRARWPGRTLVFHFRAALGLMVLLLIFWCLQAFALPARSDGVILSLAGIGWLQFIAGFFLTYVLHLFDLILAPLGGSNGLYQGLWAYGLTTLTGFIVLAEMSLLAMAVEGLRRLWRVTARALTRR